MKRFIVIYGLLIVSCGPNSNGGNLNAIINQKDLSMETFTEKYKLTQQINREQVIGKWKMIASFFTVEMPDGSPGSTILFDKERIYEYQSDGTLIVNGNQEYTSNWKLIKNNTILIEYDKEMKKSDNLEDYDDWRVRIAKDTMELIQKVDSDYIYEVLVREK